MNLIKKNPETKKKTNKPKPNLKTENTFCWKNTKENTTSI